MNKRGTGVSFCAIGALLIVCRYIAAAIFGSNVSSWDAGLFNAMLEYVGTPLKTLGIVSIIIGLAYLIWAELSKES